MLQIHKRIKAERIKANLSEDELAEKIGIGRTTYQYWEKKTPAVDKIKLVAKALGLPDDYFFVNRDENNSSKTNISQVNDDPVEYNTILPIGELKVTLKEYVDLLKESARKAEERERKLLLILEKNVIAIKANSDAILDDLSQVVRMVRSDDMAMMDSLDRIEGREPGRTRQEAGIVERAYEAEDEDNGTNDNEHKDGNSGKQKKQGA